MNRALILCLVAPIALAQDPSSPPVETTDVEPEPELSSPPPPSSTPPRLPPPLPAPQVERPAEAAPAEAAPAEESPPRTSMRDWELAPAGPIFVALHGGAIASQQPVWQFVKDTAAISDYGIMGGVDISQWFAVTAEYSHFRSRTNRTNDSADLRATYAANQLGLGVRLHPAPGGIVQPYFQSTLTGLLGRLSLNDDLRRVKSDRHLSSTSGSIGGRISIGAEIRAPTEHAIEPVFIIEVGYAGMMRHNHGFPDRDGERVVFGSMGYSSPSMRLGAGVRF